MKGGKMHIYLESGKSRAGNIRLVFSKLCETLDLNGKKILIKPNFTSPEVGIANTNPDALDSVLSVLDDHGIAESTVAEGSGSHHMRETTESTIRKFDAWDLISEHGAKFLDLNAKGKYSSMDIMTLMGPEKVKINRMYLDYDVRISMTLPKTHDSATMTGSTKNFAMPMVCQEERSMLHGTSEHWREDRNFQECVRLLNQNLANLIKIVMPDVSVIDGFIGMEGNGPIFGTPIKCGWALASDNPIACDCVAAELMGINPMNVGYLNLLCSGNNPYYPQEIKRLIPALRKDFRLHEKTKLQHKWQ